MAIVQMNMKLTVSIEGQHWSGVKEMVVPELYRETFALLKTCDDPTIAFVTGEKIVGSSAVQRILKTREDAADILAKELATAIIHEMQKSDTHNGYPKESREIDEQKN